MRLVLAALALSAGLVPAPAPLASASPNATSVTGEPPGAPAEATPCASSEGIEHGPRLTLWIEKRQAKCASLAPYQPTFLERQMLAIEKAERPALSQINLFGLYPRLQTIDHRSQVAGGVRLWRPDIRGSRLDASGNAFWSVDGFRYHDVQIGVVPHAGPVFPLFARRADEVFELANVRQDSDTPYMVYGSLAHRWAPQFDFFGIGPGARKQDQADYRLKDTLAEMVAGYRVLPALTLTGRAGYYRAATGTGEDDELPPLESVFMPAEVPGFGERPDYVRYGGSAILDGRDVPGNPHRGFVAAGEWLRYDARGAGDASFDRLGLDARAYLPLGHRQRVLALRAYGAQLDPGDTGRVPFYLLPHLGGSHTLRGVLSQRFRGERLLLLQAEYRWEASPAIELAAFLDAGAVAARRDESLGRFRRTGGLGLRLKTHEAVLARCDFAWSGEGFRLLFRFSSSY